jgi:hypothetical protein
MNDRTSGKPRSRLLRRSASGIAFLALAACGNDHRAAPGSLHVGGALIGLTSGSVVLRITGGEQLSLDQDGAFRFATTFRRGDHYQVTLVAAPAKTFTTLTGAAGVLTQSVLDLRVALEPGYQVGGVVRDLRGPMVLALEGREQLTVDRDGPFTFSTLLRAGDEYRVAIVSAPGTDTWRLEHASGRIGTSDVNDVVVRAERWRTVGGTVSGLRGALVLRNNGGDDLTIGADGPFVFAQPLLVGSGYEVQVAHRPASQRISVRHGAGTVGEDGVTDVEIVAEDKAWTWPATVANCISPDGNDADNVVAAAGSGVDGDALVAWEYGSRIFASERRGRTWTHPVRDLTEPHNPDGGYSFDPRAAIAAGGDSILCWSQRDGTVARIYASVHRSGVWRDPSGHSDHLSPLAAEDAERPLVAFLGRGHACLVWQQYVAGSGRIFKAEYRDGVWAKPASTADGISPDATHAQDVCLAASPTGDALVVWAQSDNHGYRIYKSEWRDGAWVHPAGLGDCLSPLGTDAYAPAAAFDAAGNAIVVWLQNDGTTPQVFKAERRGGTWYPPAGLSDNISPDGTAAHRAVVTMARNGDALVVWRQDVTASASALFKSERRAGVWTHPAATTAAFSVGQPTGDFAAVMDAEGNAAVAYAAVAGGPAVLLLSELRRGAWQHPSGLADRVSPVGGDVTEPWLAVDGNDDLVLTWRQHDATNFRAFLSEYR